MSQVYRVAAIEAARVAGESAEMDTAAAMLAAEVHALASSHNVSGEYLAGIGTEKIAGKRGVTDRIVYVDHQAAAAIEFGHQARDHLTWVDGLHIFGRVAGHR